DRLMRQVEYPTTVPYHGTPLVEAMQKAKADLERPENAGIGFKTLVVLTDGVDSEVEPKRIPELIRAGFQDTRIMINMVCFKAAGEERGVRQQFADVIEKDLPVRGRFLAVNQAAELVE